MSDEPVGERPIDGAADEPAPGHPFADLDDFLALPRVSSLAASADGDRVVVVIAELDAARAKFIGGIWELDPAGSAPARRLTRGATGESAPGFDAGGSLLFLAARPDTPEGSPRDTAKGTAGDTAKDMVGDPPTALWRLPRAGGEADTVLSLSGDVDGFYCAGKAPTVLVRSGRMPSARTADDDARLRALRRAGKVTAVLHDGYPVRHWDHDLGPTQVHLFDADGRDLTPDPGRGLDETTVSLSADGRFAVAAWSRPGPRASLRSELVCVEVATGERSVVAADAGADLSHPAISPDDTRVAFLRETHSTPALAPRITLCTMTFGEPWREISTAWDRWPSSVAWTADGSALVVTADDGGRAPVFAVDPTDGAVTRLTHDDFAYTDVTPVSGGTTFALRSSYAAAPHPVRIDPDGTVTELPCVPALPLPGELTEVTATAADGTPIRSWLVLPEGDAPAPLVLWVHGGPLASWASWHWRWNPWLLAAAGYAVLLPDPALSTGYGQEFIQRGWAAWGFAPYEDLMAATDEACAHPRVDATRTAVMGGSFGGYMANWIAGHTDRFDAIVTHASLWALDQFGSTTDGAYWWAREMTGEHAERNSPHHHVERIATPMLVIHGEKDYRVPIGEGLRLWFDLLTRSALPAADDGSTVHRFLHFPTENHWVLSPAHAKLWYQVVLGFLGRHVLGRDEDRPDELG